jgi:hypothetical protein
MALCTCTPPPLNPNAVLPNRFSHRLQAALPPVLLPLAALALASCGGGGGPEPQGLILSRSLFENGVPLPAALVLMTPPSSADGDWTTTNIVEQPGAVSVQTGTAPGYRSVLRRVENGVGLGPALEWALGDSGYELVEAEGVAPDEIEWDTRKGEPKTKGYEQLGGNVFHKAMWYEPPFGEPGILTISANMPSVKLWRRSGDGWEGETLFQGIVGGEEHRFRDIEAGDVDGDGVDELVLATHDRGGVYVLEQTSSGIEALRIHSTDEPYFVHEIELGDVDGDGVLEIFSTPSEPNKLDGSKQMGEVLMHDFVDGQYVESVVENSADTHAKEILAADVDGDGQVELYSAMEAEGIGGAVKANAEIRRYDFVDGEVRMSVVTELPGEMCRFLNVGDTDGDGARELIAATAEDGVIKVVPTADGWETSLIASGLFTSGFEHATCVFDIDGDGDDEVFTADDKNRHVYQWTWDPARSKYGKQELWKSPDRATFFTWGILPVPIDRL